MTPVNPIISGLAHAMQFSQMLKQQAMEQQAMDIRKRRDAREGETHDLAQRMQLNAAGAQPLDPGGNYQTTMDAVPPMTLGAGAGQPGMQMPARTEQTMVPASAGQVVESAGKKYRLPTKDETDDKGFKRQVDALRASTDIHTQGAVDTFRQERALQKTDIPGMGVVDDHAIPYLTEMEREKGYQERAINASRENDKKALNAAMRQNKRDQELETGRNQRAAANNASRERTAGIRAEGSEGKKRTLTPNASGVQGRFDQKEIDAGIKEKNRMADQEAKLWEEHKKLGDMLTTGKTLDSKGAETTINDTLRRQMTSSMGSKEKLAKELGERQRQIRERFQFGEYANGAKPGAAPADAGENPYRRKK
jgi:hypothetical protein